jgi:tRNA 2-thiocytidine biosynthesis protein TtcA
VDGMSAKESFFQGRLTVIRPLLLVEKSAIRRAAAAWNLPVWHNPCPFSERSKRLEFAEIIEGIHAGNRKRRANLFNALKRWQLDRDMSGI